MGSQPLATNELDAARGLSTPSGEVYRLFFEHASDGIFSVRLDLGVITAANQRLEDLSGFAAGQLVGAEVCCLFPTAISEPQARSFGPEILAQPGLHEDVQLRRADDYPLFAAIAVGHAETDAGPTAICVVRDTTERRLLERELITKHMALRQAHEDLQRVSRSLTQRNRELLELSGRVATLAKQAAIGAFTAGIAHSINNPLAALLSAQRRLRDIFARRAPELNDERMETLLERQQQAALRIQRVVENVRRAHSNGAPRSDPAMVNLVSELEGTLALAEERLAGVRVERCYRDYPQVAAFADELQHLFANLIDNAAHALAGSGTLTVAVQMGADLVRVTFTDDGPGLPPEILAQVFEPFVTGHANGTGLGLWLARQVAHRHRGRLLHQPVEPHGARFVFEMPVLRLAELREVAGETERCHDETP